MAREHLNLEWTIDEVLAGVLEKIQMFKMIQQYTGKSNSHDSALPTTSSFYAVINRTPHSNDRHQEKLGRGLINTVCHEHLSKKAKLAWY